MTNHVSDEELGKIARQQHELFRRIREGTLDPKDVSKKLQAIIEGAHERVIEPYDYSNVRISFELKSEARPAMYEPPESQLDKLKWHLERSDLMGFGAGDLPKVIPDFTPTTSTSVLLLAPYTSASYSMSSSLVNFRAHRELLWGYRKMSRRNTLLSSTGILHEVKPRHAGIRWVEYDYAGSFDTPDRPSTLEDAWRMKQNEDTRLASSEVLSAMLLLPNYERLMYSGDIPLAVMAGYADKVDVDQRTRSVRTVLDTSSRGVNAATVKSTWRLDARYALPTARELD